MLFQRYKLKKRLCIKNITQYLTWYNSFSKFLSSQQVQKMTSLLQRKYKQKNYSVNRFSL
jgi:hypothetical protein